MGKMYQLLLMYQKIVPIILNVLCGRYYKLICTFKSQQVRHANLSNKRVSATTQNNNKTGAELTTNVHI